MLGSPGKVGRRVALGLVLFIDRGELQVAVNGGPRFSHAVGADDLDAAEQPDERERPRRGRPPSAPRPD